MNNTRFVRSLSLLLLAAVCLSAAGCRGLAEYLKGIVEISDAGTDGPLETEGILQTEPVTDAVTQPPETRPAYVYAPDPDETFADDASRTAAKLADAAIGEGYRALCAYPDDPHVVIKDYDPSLHPTAYSTLTDSRKAIYDTVYDAVSVFGSFSYNEKEQPKGFMSEFLSVNDALAHDHPEIFSYYSMSSKGWEIFSSFHMPDRKSGQHETDVDKVRAAYEVYERVFDRIIAKMPEGISNYQKCIYLCAVISGITTYDYTYASSTDSFPPYGTLVMGRCVCQGYADTFMRLAWAAGIECDRTWGEVNGSSHVWNRVQTSLGERYVDPTWTDNVVEMQNRDVLFTAKYFLMEYEELAGYGYTNVTNHPDFLPDFFD